MLTTDLLSELKRLHDEQLHSLVNMPRQTLEDYHAVVGRCQGLQQALDVINNLLEQEDDNSGRNQRPSGRSSYYSR